jgi:hypothetical protein
MKIHAPPLNGVQLFFGGELEERLFGVCINARMGINTLFA